MKRLRVTLECVLELPDHVRLEEPVGDGMRMLFIHGRFVEPILDWTALTSIGPEDGQFTQADVSGELEEELESSLREILVCEMSLEDEGPA